MSRRGSRPSPGTPRPETGRSRAPTERTPSWPGRPWPEASDRAPSGEETRRTRWILSLPEVFGGSTVEPEVVDELLGVGELVRAVDLDGQQQPGADPAL